MCSFKATYRPSSLACATFAPGSYMLDPFPWFSRFCFLPGFPSSPPAFPAFSPRFVLSPPPSSPRPFGLVWFRFVCFRFVLWCIYFKQSMESLQPHSNLQTFTFGMYPKQSVDNWQLYRGLFPIRQWGP